MSASTETSTPFAAATFGGLSLRAWRGIGLVALAVVALAPPVLLSNFPVFQLTLALAYSIAVLGLNMLTGYNGQISLGHGAFYAIGAYVTAILMDRFGVPYWLTVPAAAGV